MKNYHDVTVKAIRAAGYEFAHRGKHGEVFIQPNNPRGLCVPVCIDTSKISRNIIRRATRQEYVHD
jgi:hypothetical protein